MIEDENYLEIWCKFTDSEGSEKGCDLISNQTYVRYKPNSLCLTFFEQQIQEKNKVFAPNSKRHFFRFLVMNYEQADFIFHPHYSPSHFERKIFPIKTDEFTIVYFQQTVRKYLPSPYATNCRDYSSNALNNVWPKSQTDCKLEYMRREEHRICGQNYYWTQQLFDYNNQTFNYNNTPINCSVKAKDHFLNQVCKTDCLFTEYQETMQVHLENFPKPVDTVIGSYFSNEKNIVYIPKMDMVAYLSAFGGLVSMWTGYSIFFIIKKLSINKGLIYILIYPIRYLLQISSYLTKMAKTCSFLLCTFVMFYQLFETAKTYLDSTKVIDISFKTDFTFPRMYLQMYFLGNTRNIPKIIKNMMCHIETDQLIVECPEPQMMLSIITNKYETIGLTLSLFDLDHWKNFSYPSETVKLIKLQLNFQKLMFLTGALDIRNSLYFQQYIPLTYPIHE